MKNEMQQLGHAQMLALSRFCYAALLILNARALTFIAMLVTAAAFGVVMWQPDPYRLGAAALFAMLVFWPCVKLQRGEQPDPITTAAQQPQE